MASDPLQRTTPAAWVVLLAVAGAGLGVPLLMGGGSPNQATLTANRERIAEMTAVERKRLEMRFERFRALDAAEQSRLREMHEAIAADPELDRVLDVYRRWIETLSPGQRDALRDEADPTARLRLVREYRDQQERESERWSGPWGGGLANRFPIDTEGIERVYELLTTKLDARDQERIEGTKSDLLRHVRILVASLRKAGGRPGDPRTRDRWPDSDLVTEIAEVAGSRMLRMPGPADSKRSRIAMMFVAGLQKEIAAEMTTRRPSEEQLREVYSNLSAEDRERITGMPKDEFRRELSRRYAMDKFSELPELKSLMFTLSAIRGRGVGGRPGGGRPGGPPGGPNGRPGGPRGEGPRGEGPGGGPGEPPRGRPRFDGRDRGEPGNR